MARVLLTWLGDTVAVKTVRPGETLYLGEAPGDLPLPGVEGRHVLVKHAGAALRVCLPTGAVLGAAIGDRVRRCSSSGYEVIAGGGLTIRIGDLCLDVSHDLTTPVPPSGWRGSLGLLALGMLMILGCVLDLAASRLHPLDEPERSNVVRHVRVDAFMNVRAEAERLRPPLDLTSPAEHWPAPGEPVRCGDDLAGIALATLDGRFETEGPMDNPDPHLAREGAESSAADSAPVTEPSTTSIVATRAAVRPWGRDTSLGRDQENAWGVMWHDEVADARGSAGMGAAEVESGQHKHLTILPRVGDPSQLAPRIVHTDLRINGALKPSAVARAMAPRFERVRACYDELLREGTPFSGRVVVRFDVSSEGFASNLQVTSSAAVDSGFDQCLGAAFSETPFDMAAAGASVHYPLEFMAYSVGPRAFRTSPEGVRQRVPCTSPCKS